MSAKLVAEYAVADHLVVYSEGSISIWKREASLRPARERLREAAVLAPHQQRAAAVQGLYAGRSAAAEALGADDARKAQQRELWRRSIR